MGHGDSRQGTISRGLRRALPTCRSSTLTAGHAARPVLWMVTPEFGAHSQVWMYRQACHLTSFDLCVITDRHVNPHEYPAKGFDVQVVTHHDLPPAPWRYIHYLLNYRSGFFRVAHADERRWRRQLALRRPDAILAQFGTSAVRLLPLARGHTIPLVVHFHGFDISKNLRNAWYPKQLLASLPHFAACVVVADYQRQWLEAHGVAPEKIWLIPCGVPIRDFAVSRVVMEQPCRFLSIGRFVSKKRHDYVLRAFAKCRTRFPDSQLRIIGSGAGEPSCRRLAAELNVSTSVTFLGEQTIDRVESELRQAQSYVQHSVTGKDGDMEGWPVSIAEAAATGLPVVASRHAGIEQQVTHEITGLLVNEHDWEGMAAAMIRLAGDPLLRRRLGEAGRRLISAFDLSIQIQTLTDCLLKAAGRTGDSPRVVACRCR